VSRLNFNLHLQFQHAALQQFRPVSASVFSMQLTAQQRSFSDNGNTAVRLCSAATLRPRQRQQHLHRSIGIQRQRQFRPQHSAYTSVSLTALASCKRQQRQFRLQRSTSATTEEITSGNFSIQPRAATPAEQQAIQRLTFAFAAATVSASAASAQW
jgi:hypothetical protein